MSYSVKYASAFYGPFRDAADGAPKFGDRKTHQMDPGNTREAIREARLDVEEGADFLMVKPALAYLDVISDLRDGFDLPIVAYNVSGEYSMLIATAERGWGDLKGMVRESTMALARSVTDLFISYWANQYRIFFE